MKKRKESKPDFITIILFILILALAAFLRLYKLDNRPAHFDEGGGHAIGARELLNTGNYVYDPDFHGPFLYHITALTFYLFGMSDITLRITQALLGIGTVLILFPLRKYLSKISFLLLSLSIAISPSLVYYSRFAVHDSYFVFFTTASIVFLFLYSKTQKDIYFYSFAASLAFLFTVKENSFIFVGVLGIYFLVEFLFSLKKGKTLNAKIKNSLNDILDWIKDNKKMILISIVIFVFIFSAVYTTFFRHMGNLVRAITQPFIHWLKKTTEHSGFVQPYTFYLRILTDYEFVIFYPAILGIFCVIIENNSYTRFTSIFGLLILLIFLLMPYKEPNNIVHVVLPLALSSGMFFEVISKKIKREILLTIAISVVLISFYTLSICWKLSFVKYSDEDNYLVYVQTVDDIKPMLKMIKDITDKRGKDIAITVDVPQTEYPLSWYFRDYTNVRYISEKVELPTSWTGIKWSGDGMLIWDRDAAKSGNRSAKIDGRNGTDGEWRQKIPVVGGYYYTLSGWIKTENIQVVDAGKYAKMYVRTDKNNEPDQIIAETNSLIGTNDWKRVETRFFVERGINDIWLTMTIGNWGKTKGKIWFDDISLTREGTSVNLIKNPSFEFGEKIDKLLNVDILIVSENDGQTLMDVPGYNMSKYLLRPGVNLAVYVKE